MSHSRGPSAVIAVRFRVLSALHYAGHWYLISALRSLKWENVGNDPDPITSFMTDPGDTNAAVLHRRSIIHASLESVGFGVALSEPNGDRGSRLIAALGKPTYLQTPAEVPNGIAWPPRGFVPLEFFPDSGFRTTEGPRWSFTLRGAANFAAATVSMRLNGEVVPAKVVWPRPSRGEPSATIVWELPVRHRAAKNTRYDVTISGVTGAPSASYSYVVLPFDPKDPNQPIDPLALRTAGLVGPGASPLSVTRFPDGRLDLFGLGYDLSMQHKAWPAGAVAGRYDGVFASLGAPFLATVPSAVSWEAGRIDLFALDINRVLRHRAWRDGAFSNSNDAWEDLGGESASPPAVVAPAKDRLDVVVVGTDGAAWHKSWNGSRWVDWASLGGAFKSPVAAASWGADRLDVFGLDGAFRVLHRSRTNGTWAPTWTSLGPRVFNSVPAPVSAGPNQLAVFGIGTDGALCQKSWVNGAWTKEWASLGKSRGGEFVGTLSVVSSGQGRIDVFALGKDRNIYHRAFSGGKWEPEANLGGGFNWGPVATVVGANTLHVFAMRSDRTIHHNSLATTTIASLGQGRNEETVRQVWSTWQLVGGPFAKVSGVFVDQR